jgi:NADH dehydrogenase
MRAGHAVVSLGRGLRAPGHGYPVTNFRIDLVRPVGLDEALRGVEVVVHAAGILTQTRGQSFERTHVGGTENLIAACRRGGVHKLVYLSALGTRKNASTAYLRTKWEGEQAVEASGIPYTIFRPSLIFGVGDHLVSSLLAFLRYAPLLPSIGPEEARVQPIWVGDVATAVVRCIGDATTNGAIYNLAGPDTISLGALVDTIKAAAAPSLPRIPVPPAITGLFVRLAEQLLHDPPFSSEQFALLATTEACDPGPAAVTFGLRMRSLADVLSEYVDGA